MSWGRGGVTRLAWVVAWGILLASQAWAHPLAHQKAGVSQAPVLPGGIIGAGQRVELDGIVAEFSLQAVDPSLERQDVQAGQTVLAQFSLREARTGEPLSLGRPKAWMNARLSETVAGEHTCADKIRGFAG